MKSEKLRSCIAVVAILGWGLFLSGCTYNRIQLADGRALTVERLPSSPLSASWVHAQKMDHELVINGELTGSSRYAHGTGHVDLAIIGPSGELLAKTSVYYAPKSIGRKGSVRQPRFEARFPLVPPDGSRVRVALHSNHGPSVEDRAFDCGDNRAAQENAH